MSEFQLTHIALVGARMTAFHDYGFHTRNELSLRRVAPELTATQVELLGRRELVSRLKSQFPLWIHNIIVDPGFPGRSALMMPLRRFEGELRDSRDDEVISAVLSNGFRNQTFDPLNLPNNMPMRQRCAVVVHIRTWQDAYQRLEREVLKVLADEADMLARWCSQASQPDYEMVV
jgi:hypothetical protein